MFNLNLNSKGSADYRYLVQQYDKDYHIWSRDLIVQMEMTAWVSKRFDILGSDGIAYVSSEWAFCNARYLSIDQ